MNFFYSLGEENKMKKALMIIVCSLILFPSDCLAQQNSESDPRRGFGLIETKVYTAEEDAEILKLFEGLRVADVSDGMDMAGLPGAGLVDPEIHACWLDEKDFAHQFRGIAVTARYVPTQRPDRPRPSQKFQDWEGNFYNAYSSETFADLIRSGTAVVIDDVEEKDIGSIGSYNILEWYRRGAAGVVTDAGARDTDEIAIEKVPLYLRKKGRGIRPGRNELESVNRPVAIGGVLVCPGDIIVADRDGVVVVPRHAASKVAAYARDILDKDKAARKNLYESLRRSLDKTVK